MHEFSVQKSQLLSLARMKPPVRVVLERFSKPKRNDVNYYYFCIKPQCEGGTCLLNPRSLQERSCNTTHRRCVEPHSSNTVNKQPQFVSRRANIIIWYCPSCASITEALLSAQQLHQHYCVYNSLHTPCEHGSWYCVPLINRHLILAP